VTYAIVPLAVAVLCIWLGRRLAAVMVFFGYLTLDGFLKLLSNYNRIVHIGADIVLWALVGAWILDAVARRRARLPDAPFSWLIGLYALWMLMELLNPYSASLMQSLASYKIHLSMVPLYFLAAALVRRRRDVEVALTGLVVIALVPYVMALGQYALGPQSVLDLSPRFWQNISYYHEWRPFGTSALPGGAAVFAFLFTPLAVALLVGRAPGKLIKLLVPVSLILASGTFIVSGVRQLTLGCVLALLVMVALVTSRGRGRGLATLMLFLVLAVGAYVGVQTFLRPMATEALLADPRVPQIWKERSVTDRVLTLAKTGTYLEARRGALQSIWLRVVDYPLGAGLGRTGATAGAFAGQLRSEENERIQHEVGWSDNFFADMITEAGIPGMLLLSSILVIMLARAVRLARRLEDPLLAATAAATAGLLFSLLVMSWGSQPLMGNPITALFWFLSGLMAALPAIDAPPPSPERGEREARVPAAARA
jgi:hypothetical protein